MPETKVEIVRLRKSLELKFSENEFSLFSGIVENSSSKVVSEVLTCVDLVQISSNLQLFKI